MQRGHPVSAQPQLFLILGLPQRGPYQRGILGVIIQVANGVAGSAAVVRVQFHPLGEVPPNFRVGKGVQDIFIFIAVKYFDCHFAASFP